jgi:glucokinase
MRDIVGNGYASVNPDPRRVSRSTNSHHPSPVAIDLYFHSCDKVAAQFMNNLYASVDLGGTNISAALADADGSIVADAKQPTQSHEGPQAVLERIAGMINALASRTGKRPTALGVGLPGLMDLASGVTKFLPNLPTHWRDVPVRMTLEPKIGCPVYLLNDARAATLGEMSFGSGRDAHTMILFTLGTGIGGGVVVDRQLRLGPLGAAGELGHQTILLTARLAVAVVVAVLKP